MEMILVSVVFTAMLLMSICMVIRNNKFKALATAERRYASVILFVGAFMIIVGELLHSRGTLNLLMDVMLISVPMSVLLMSVVNDRLKKATVIVSLILELLLSLYYIVSGFSDIDDAVPSCMSVICLPILAAICASVYMTGLYLRIKTVRLLLQSGSVWSWLRLAVDSFYCLALIILSLSSVVMSDSVVMIWIIWILMVMYMTACSWRIISDSQFALMQRHERRIVESMKLLPVEVVGASSRDDDVYKELFDRIQKFFEEEKPYLNGNLTINDVVAEVFSNKVYISRAISQFTGRNFCQYVNYHRVMYIMDYYRAHPDLKVSDLWPVCGFNTIVSFNMAFRLFVGENPSDWCRREKIRMSRKRK